MLGLIISQKEEEATRLIISQGKEKKEGRCTMDSKKETMKKMKITMGQDCSILILCPLYLYQLMVLKGQQGEH
ncbi:hypothetical protein CSUI_011586, partial [Cystoisospora suis]